MKKLIFIAGAAVAVVAVAAAVYYGRFLFIQTVVEEQIPQEMNPPTLPGGGMKSGLETAKQGEFREIDFIHKGSGRASLLKDESGHKIIRFEDFKVTNGPDLYVYLSRNPAPGKSKESLGEFVSLGRLKGNVGSQNYDAPQDAEDYASVVIWCRQFGALFSYATLE
ncbi:MAG: DM13 domain-containing protein [Candidatus Sungbacteria bacterium]|nr:DM13 domain-containing protein [Candidatus Sungbacteria bacterium]